MYRIYCSIKRKLAKGVWYALLERYGVYGWYIYFLLHGTAFSCTQECRTFVHYYCSVEVFIKNCILCFFGKIYSPFSLQNCLFLFTAYFA